MNGNRQGRLHGRVAVITGGASGIGAAAARLFVGEGARVVLGDLAQGAGEALAQELNGLAGAPVARFLRSDVTQLQEVEALVAAAERDAGRGAMMLHHRGLRSFGPPRPPGGAAGEPVLRGGWGLRPGAPHALA